MIAISEIKKKYGNSSIALVILCCRIHFKTAKISDLNDFIDNSKVDWLDFRILCRKHHIRPIVYRIILKTNLPQEVQEIINSELIKLTIKSLQQAKETERLILLLNKNGINAIPYKGTAFSKQFFGNINMRESSDIDLVISKVDLPISISILENDNYIAPLKEHYDWIGHEKFVKNYKDLCFAKFNKNVREHSVELHFNIIAKHIYVPNDFNKFNTQLLDKTKLIKEEITLLNPTEHFRAIILHHMLMDSMGHLKTLIDITQALNELKLKDIIKKSSSYDQKKINQLNTIYNIEIVTSVINNLIGVNLQLNETKKNKKHIILIKRILSTGFRKNRKNHIPIWDAINYQYINLKYISIFYNKKRDKFLLLLKISFNIIKPKPEEYKLIKINKKFHFLYILIRPFRLIFKPIDPNKHKKPSTQN